MYLRPYADPHASPDTDVPRFCQVSIDCLALDSRPFRPCYVGTEPCEGTGGFMNAAPRVVLKIASGATLPDTTPKK